MEEENRHQLHDLLHLMARLRDPQSGCPWDLEQSPSSIINYSIEEVYELAEVVETAPMDWQAFKDELGDVLLQVVFMAQFASEESAFDFNDVVDHLCQKMVRRHPHVFPHGELYDSQKTSEVECLTAQDVKQNWQEIKRKEKPQQDNDEVNALFGNIPGQLPALMWALKYQKRTAKIGLDWPDPVGPLQKIKEEFTELEDAIRIASNSVSGVAENGRDPIGEELGDLLFSIVNLARKLERNPEQLLRGATRKFADRASKLVAMLPEQLNGISIESASEEQLDRLWALVKSKEA